MSTVIPQLTLVSSTAGSKRLSIEDCRHRIARKASRLVTRFPQYRENVEAAIEYCEECLEEIASMSRPVAPSPEAPRYRTLWRQRRAPSAGLENPKPPALPAGVIENLEEYYAACGAIGLLSSQAEAPDPDEAIAWSLDFGERMAKEARRRWARKR